MVDELGTVVRVQAEQRERQRSLDVDEGLVDATWTNVNVSDVAWNPDEAFFTCGCFIGDYNGLAVGDPFLYPVWTDGRNSAGSPLGQTDIFTDVIGVE